MPSCRSINMSCARWCISCSFTPSSLSNRDLADFPLAPEFLSEMVTEPDGKSAKSRFERLLGVKEHEMHHRAQLMLIERQLGIVPHLTRQFNERVAQMRAARA